MCLGVALFIGLVILVVWVFMSRKRREGFKVLGTLANQKDVYYQCLSECEKTDPQKQLGRTHGSRSCTDYCDSTITDMVRRGGPSYPNDFRLPPTPVVTRIDESYRRCGDGTKGEWCRSLFSTDGEIDSRCRQECEYSTMSPMQCMKQCTASRVGNRYIGWNWK